VPNMKANSWKLALGASLGLMSTYLCGGKLLIRWKKRWLLFIFSLIVVLESRPFEGPMCIVFLKFDNEICRSCISWYVVSKLISLVWFGVSIQKLYLFEWKRVCCLSKQKAETSTAHSKRTVPLFAMKFSEIVNNFLRFLRGSHSFHLE